MKLDNLFINDFSSKKSEIESIIRDHWIILDQYDIDNFGSISVNGNVKFSTHMNYLTEIPLTFTKVTGDFDCSRLKLNTLKGSPIEVGGNFDCTFNPLASLEYAPRKVGKTFAFDNTIKSLFTGGKNSNFNEVEMFIITDIPELIELPDIITDNDLFIILKYQNYYDIWNPDKTLNLENMMGLVEDIMDGLE